MPAPDPPTYQGASGTPTSGGGSPDDIFDLGKLYGQKVYLGEKPTPSGPTNLGGVIGAGGKQVAGGSGGTVKLDNTSTHVWGTTQEEFAKISRLYNAQAAERKKHPHDLTSYEQLQQELWQAGFYGQTSYDSIHVGQWTPQTEDAIRGALTSYEQILSSTQDPITFTEFIQQNQTGALDGGENGKGKGKTKAPPPPVSLQDPASIRQAAQAAAVDALGYGLTSDQLDRFVSQFQSAQVSAHDQAYADGSTAFTEPDLSSQASAYVQSNDPQGYQNNQRQAYVSSLVNLLVGPGDVGRPQQTPVPKA